MIHKALCAMATFANRKGFSSSSLAVQMSAFSSEFFAMRALCHSDLQQLSNVPVTLFFNPCKTSRTAVHRELWRRWRRPQSV